MLIRFFHETRSEINNINVYRLKKIFIRWRQAKKVFIYSYFVQAGVLSLCQQPQQGQQTATTAMV